MSATSEHVDQLRGMAEKPRAGIMDKSICLRVQFRKPGQVRKVGSQTQVMTSDADPNQGELIDGVAPNEKTASVSIINEKVATDLTLVRISKYIMDAPEFASIVQLDTKVRKYLTTKALPSIFAKGIWLIPLDVVGELDIVLTNYCDSRTGLVETFMAAYERIKADAKDRLQDLFDERNYPSEAALREMFSMRWEYISYGVSEKLAAISQDMYQREQEKQRVRVGEAADECRALLREGMSKLIEHARERLTPKENGKAKRILPSMLPQINEFLESFSSKNITEDTQLAELVHRAKELLTGVDTDTLKANEGLRDAVLHGFDAIKTTLDTLVEERPSRKMRFAVEESEA